MRQWKSLVPAALHLHGPAASCFPHPPSPSPCPSPPRAGEEQTTTTDLLLLPPQGATKAAAAAVPQQQAKVVRLVGCDGKVRAYAPPVTARELMQEHPRHLVCRADALLIGEKIPAVAAGEELQPGEAYFLLPAHLFRSVLSFVSLASSLLLLLSSSAAATGAGAGKKPGAGRPFELHRTASGTLQIKFSDDFLLADAGKGEDDAPLAEEEEKQAQPQPAVLLRGDDRLAKDYEELVGYGKSRRWAPKLETIEEVVAPAAGAVAPESADPGAGAASPRAHRSRTRRALPFLGRLGSRRRHRSDACSSSSSAAVVACSG